MKARRFILAFSFAAAGVVSATASSFGDVTGVTGSATATVIEYYGTTELERDFNRQSVPETAAAPPVVARAQLDRLDAYENVTAGGQVVAVFDRPNYSGLGTPNDAGLDLGAFSADEATSWFAQGTVSETRKIVLGANEVGGDARRGSRGRVRSRLVLSGVLLILSSQADADLSQVEARFRFTVVQRETGRDPVELLTGSAALVGGANGAVELVRGAGALSGSFLPLLDAPAVIPELPIVKALPFTGLNIPYEYEAGVGEEFELELSIEAHVQTIPGGTGAAAVFGTPLEGLASVLGRVKQSDLGDRVAAAIAKQVDTTGAAYQDAGNAATLFSPFSACGLLGMETLAAGVIVGGVSVRRFRRGLLARGARRTGY
jgi:hypothetical protein